MTSLITQRSLVQIQPPQPFTGEPTHFQPINRAQTRPVFEFLALQRRTPLQNLPHNDAVRFALIFKRRPAILDGRGDTRVTQQRLLDVEWRLEFAVQGPVRVPERVPADAAEASCGRCLAPIIVDLDPWALVVCLLHIPASFPRSGSAFRTFNQAPIARRIQSC